MALMWCEYFALCDRPAEGIVKNPIIGDVPSCGRCASRMEQTLIPFTVNPHTEAS